MNSIIIFIIFVSVFCVEMSLLCKFFKGKCDRLKKHVLRKLKKLSYWKSS